MRRAYVEGRHVLFLRYLLLLEWLTTLANSANISYHTLIHGNSGCVGYTDPQRKICFLVVHTLISRHEIQIGRWFMQDTVFALTHL